MSAEPRQIAVVRDYLGLIEALRARVLELGINYTILGQRTGFGESVTSKHFATFHYTKHADETGKKVRPTKRYFGEDGFDAYLPGLAVKLIVVEDTEELEKLRAWMKRNEIKPNSRKRVLPIGSMPRATWLISRKRSPWLNKLRNEKVPADRRKEIARTAALKRWKKPHVVEITNSAAVQKSGALPPIQNHVIARGASQKKRPAKG
jgi:hypothetical protein